MSEQNINRIFTNLDTWRHLPAYQLERRADIFFSLYLAEVLQKKFGLSEAPILIPEFPVRYGTVRDSLNKPGLFGKAGSNQSFKIDYLAVTKDGRRIFFIELKTDMASRNDKQDGNMEQAVEMASLLLFSGIEKMHEKSNEKQKYLALYNYLHDQLHTNERPLSKISDGKTKGIIQVTDFEQFFKDLNKVPVSIVYLQPNIEKTKEGMHYIDFSYFADFVEKHPDYLSLRFAKSLREWAKDEAGSPK